MEHGISVALCVALSAGLAAGCGGRKPFDCGRPGAVCGTGEVCITDLCAESAPECASGFKWAETAYGMVGECVPVMAPDAGTEPDGPMAQCGNGTREQGEDCDEQDLGGADCTAAGDFVGGALACAASGCVFDTTGCVAGPSVPVLRKPMNNSYVGTHFVAGTKRPRFEWEPSTAPGGEGVAYELQYSTDKTLVTGVTTVMAGAATSHQPAADLATSAVQPVGARYYWRVRACVAAGCTGYSATWWVNVGRSPKDFNGDGYADVAIGTPEASTVGVYLGGTDQFGALETTVDVTISGVAGERLGESVAFVGDVNADGFADLAAGAPDSSVAATGAGRVLVFFGSATPNASAEAELRGSQVNEQFGFAVAGAGDVDADGFDDIAVGAPASNLGASGSGAVFVYRGNSGSTVDATSDMSLPGSAGGDHFGSTVDGIGDADGDGRSDLLVGAPDVEIGGQTNGGRAYLVQSTMPEPSLILIDGAQAGEGFASDVAGAGDLNGDGFADWIIGARAHSPPMLVITGAAYVYFGARALDVQHDGLLYGAKEVFGGFGLAVAGGGDVDGDGFADIVVGEPGGGPLGEGQAKLFKGAAGTTFDASADAVLTGFKSTSDFGDAVSTRGDLNGDRFDDVIVADPNDVRVRAYFGGPGAFQTTSDGTMLGGPSFGESVAR